MTTTSASFTVDVPLLQTQVIVYHTDAQNMSRVIEHKRNFGKWCLFFVIFDVCVGVL